MNLIKRVPDFFDDDTFRFPNRFLDRPFLQEALLSDAGAPAVNIKEAQNEFLIEMATPGYRKEDLHVDLEDGVLTIWSERNEEKNEEKQKFTRREFRYTRFRRSFSLPPIADEGKVKASFQDGVLRLSVPKVKDMLRTKTAKQIAIG